MATKPTLAQPNGLHGKFELSSPGRLGPVGYTASPAKGVGDGSLYCRILLTAFTSTGPGSLASHLQPRCHSFQAMVSCQIAVPVM